MQNSHKFFTNPSCKYYPCHVGIRPFNCMFCYCALFNMEDCEGDYTITATGCKDCSNCHIPHLKDSWDYIVDKLTKNVSCSTKQDSVKDVPKTRRKPAPMKGDSLQS